MALTLASAADLLKEHHLLREIIQGMSGPTTRPVSLRRMSRSPASPTTPARSRRAPCCAARGQFKAEYLNGIDEAGLAAYVWPKPSTQPQPPPRPDRQRRT